MPPPPLPPLPAWLKIDPVPLCGLEPDPETQRLIEAKRYDFAWLEAEPTVRAQLESSGLPVVGTVIDHAHKRLLVVVEPTFKDWESLPSKLQTPSIGLTFRPACHDKAARDAAEEKLRTRAWHPRAKTTALSWSPDPSIGGFAVTVDETAPEVAQSLEKALGDLVRVKLGKPQRLGQR